MKEKVHVFNEVLTERYLGLPTDVGRSKGGVFKYLKDRVWSKVQGWMEQSLPVGGKEVLIKAVAQAVPTYSMSCFQLPRGLLPSNQCNDSKILVGQQGWQKENMLGVLGEDDTTKISWWSWISGY